MHRCIVDALDAPFGVFGAAALYYIIKCLALGLENQATKKSRICELYLTKQEGEQALTR